MDRGELPHGLLVTNLFEGDLFSWFLEEAPVNVDLTDCLRDVVNILGDFAFPRIAFGANPALDILRDLYQVLVPRPLRRALGEFLTPEWLAEAAVDRVRQLDGGLILHGRVLDPTCGTGTFLLPILRRRIALLRSQGENATDPEQVQAMLDDVVGFDINPVAVVAARVNFLVALGDLATTGALTMPVYQTDSVLVPEAPIRQGDMLTAVWARSEFREVRTSLEFTFPIPLLLASASRIPGLREAIENSLVAISSDEAMRLFQEDLTRRFGPDGLDSVSREPDEWANVAAVASELFSRVWGLHAEGRDGVWPRIVENAFAPLFSGRFDLVIGNPPWITWTRLPQSWRRAAEPVWRRYGLWSVPTEQGGRRALSLASTDLAVLVFAVALDRYAKEGGLVVLLTPDSLVTADPGGRAFRRFRLQPDDTMPGGPDVPFRVTHLDDWSGINPFSPDASNRPILITARRNSEQTYPVTTSRWRRRTAGGRLGDNWQVVRHQLREELGQSSPVDPRVPTAAWSFQPNEGPRLLQGGSNLWEFGKGLDTRGANGVFIVTIRGTDQRSGLVEVENDPQNGRNPNVQRTRGWVEANLVYPFLRGRDVSAWSASPSSYILAPYESHRFLGESGLHGYHQAHLWLRRHRAILAGRRSPPTRSWDMDGEDWARLDGPIHHMARPELVVVRELQQRPAAALVTARHDAILARYAIPLIDHKLLFCGLESRAEALYLVSMINSTPIQDLLASFANQIAVSPQTLARLPIPAYRESAETEELVELAAQIIAADDATAHAAENQALLDRLVISILG